MYVEVIVREHFWQSEEEKKNIPNRILSASTSINNKKKNTCNLYTKTQISKQSPLIDTTLMPCV